MWALLTNTRLYYNTCELSKAVLIAPKVFNLPNYTPRDYVILDRSINLSTCNYAAAVVVENKPDVFSMLFTFIILVCYLSVYSITHNNTSTIF